MEDNIFQTASDIAYQIICRKILDGELTPGMKLPLRKMAEMTNLSVIPVMEALKRLTEDGLVESKPRWGSYVTVPTKEKVINSIQVREALECQVARIMCKKITEDQYRKLLQIATELDTIPYKGDGIEPSRANHMLFHNQLADFTENPILSRMLRHINLFWILCKALKSVASHAEYPRYWHRALLDEIMSGDCDRAEKAMRDHVLNSLDPILKTLET